MGHLAVWRIQVRHSGLTGDKVGRHGITFDGCERGQVDKHWSNSTSNQSHQPKSTFASYTHKGWGAYQVPQSHYPPARPRWCHPRPADPNFDTCAPRSAGPSRPWCRRCPACSSCSAWGPPGRATARCSWCHGTARPATRRGCARWSEASRVVFFFFSPSRSSSQVSDRDAPLSATGGGAPPPAVQLPIRGVAREPRPICDRSDGEGWEVVHRPPGFVMWRPCFLVMAVRLNGHEETAALLETLEFLYVDFSRWLHTAVCDRRCWPPCSTPRPPI